jgi:hypothetical protein
MSGASQSQEDMPYEMVIDLNVLNHLGIHLYSNVAAVLSEAVANSWDADAASIRIDLNEAAGRIVISDDGLGMSKGDINSRFLRVGYAKRETEGDLSSKNRQFMGRKGIGKLSLFSIADQITVKTIKEGIKSGFSLSLAAIRTAIAARQNYYPPALPASELSVDSGTEITLTQLKKGRLRLTANALRRRLARRFVVVGRSFQYEKDGSTHEDQFRVWIDGTEVTDSDREDIRLLQFLWNVGKGPRFASDSDSRVAREDDLTGTVDQGRGWTVRGWIGAAERPRQLVTDDGANLNSIVVLSRGRLIQENILDRINDGRLVTKYLTGQLEADFLDDTTRDDIATSDRQRVIEDDERYIALEHFVRQRLNEVATAWTNWRNELGAAVAQQEHPSLAAWIAALPSDAAKRNAGRVIGQIQALPIDKEDDRKVLFRHGIYAFERMALRHELDKFADALEKGVDQLLPLFGQVDDIEAALYLDIVRGRLKVIQSFQTLVDANDKERVLQQYLFDHLWLLDPSWERATGTELMEQRVLKEFEDINAQLSTEELSGRVDIKYRTTAGKHVIVELKRAGRSLSIQELVKQGRLYKEATRKCLIAAGRREEPIEIVFVLGQPVSEAHDSEFVERQLDSIRARLVQYDQLIDAAQLAYRAYTESAQVLSRLEEIMRSL